MTRLRGQDAAIEAFLSASAGGTIHHAWLLAGPQGIGKASFARTVALRLLAEGMTPGALPPGLSVPDTHQAAHLFAAGTHPDYRELRRLPKKDSGKGGSDEELARSITIDQVRGLGPFLGTAPSMSPRRVIVMDAADDLERPGASNALLKNLEEPPAGTVFLLVSHAPGRLLPTIRSRCRVLRFDPLGDADMAAVLRDVMPDADEVEIAALVRAGGGSPGRAMGYAGLDLAGIDTALTAIGRDGDPANARRAGLAKVLSPKAAQARYEAFLDRVPTVIAQMAAMRHGEDLRRALDAYDEARGIAAAARGLSLDAQGTVYELAGVVARLAPRP
ncbi:MULTISPECIES: DNA polymerase III subunit delta' [Sphingomonas]|uniref:DNA polymerase III subunit delta n=1 Tax=Sphingomonas adhaesiva TaxID=28212 RepID=A0A2A4IBA7_9SPHN|nr:MULTISPECIES: DNA polymerase III subunit delta' [Sphingomonas]PCG15881.1 DNA polymerase III subunit delta' [Sphingomonas adhaesiva]PZU80784.1 MAG: DNA polymerase III subunit delta' [Sphingomonas sp.]